jgi:preprotein translocase subunit SecA
MSDKIYLTLDEKLEAIAQDVEGCQKTGQPVLVGTSSIENSEAISTLLTQKKVKHEVLNAKQHEREAQIIANAGAIGAVTIATNMAFSIPNRCIITAIFSLAKIRIKLSFKDR